jgi:hypothetical protein
MRFSLRRARLLVSFLPFLLAVPAAAQSSPSDPLVRWRAQVNATRLERLRQLMPQLIPNCHFEATASDVAGFMVYWRKMSAGGPQAPGAEGIARRQIETWKLYHCVATYFDGHRYFSRNGNVGADGLGWPVRPLLTAQPVWASQPIVPVPDVGNLEPVEALAKFFHTAEGRGLLKFSTDQEQIYFFTRYEAISYVNMKDESKAIDWFRSPPWLAAEPR